VARLFRFCYWILHLGNQHHVPCYLSLHLNECFSAELVPCQLMIFVWGLLVWKIVHLFQLYFRNTMTSSLSELVQHFWKVFQRKSFIRWVCNSSGFEFKHNRNMILMFRLQVSLISYYLLSCSVHKILMVRSVTNLIADTFVTSMFQTTWWVVACKGSAQACLKSADTHHSISGPFGCREAWSFMSWMAILFKQFVDSM
jgi:hypothetical protein